MNGPLMLIIMDGFGISKEDKNNAIKVAKTNNLDKIFSQNPFTTISACGESVGLPDGQMGNSEVGHTNIGAGRIVYQELTRITKAIKNGDFFENKAFLSAIDNVKKNDTSLHLMGLLSDGGVHSHEEHLYALLRLAKEKGVKKVYIHAFLDGRDTSPTSGIEFIKKCQKIINDIGVGKISTIMGRYYAMDRDKRFDRTQKAYEALVCGIGERCDDPYVAIKHSYDNDVTDEFIKPVILDNEGRIRKNDSIIFFNFRPDRARQLTRSLVDKSFDGFKRKDGFFSLKFICMTNYDSTIDNVDVAFAPEDLKNTFGEYISRKGLKQLRIAETEKYAHVTFFFNGGKEKEYENEDRILVPSPKVATYDLKPSMSAYEITERVEEAITSLKYNVIILNFANCDMVGHTGDFNATVKAVETVDVCVGRIIKEILKTNGCAIITADHGNADKMYDDSGKPFTAHTLNPVPLCIVGYECSLKSGGKLADIAPTMLDILNLEKPPEMSGKSLIN